MLASHIRRGNVIVYEGSPHRVLDFQHRTPGNLRAFVQARLRNLVTGNSINVRFSSTEVVERATLEQHEMEYMYNDGTNYHFMNTETFEQIEMDSETLGSSTDFLVEGAKINVEYYEGQPIAVDLPSSIELTVVETTPELKGATVSNTYKPAKLETGVTIQVPPFIKEGDRVKVNPSDGTYQERAKA